jgi:CBS domain containing-hemolysin-like protein
VDEYGGTAGLVKLVDVLERIVGQIPDEFSATDPDITRLDDGTTVIDGLTSLAEVAEQTGLDLTSDAYDTIGGYVLGEIGRRPRVGDTVTYRGTVFEVEEVDGLRVARIRIRPASKVEDKQDSMDTTGG